MLLSMQELLSDVVDQCGQAAGPSVTDYCSVVAAVGTTFPCLNLTASRTNRTRCGALTLLCRHRALLTSMYALDSTANRDPTPLGFRIRTFAGRNTLSITALVRRYSQYSA